MFSFRMLILMLDEEEWTDLTAMSHNQPGTRYGHSAVVANNAMWVYGGMTGLQPRSDIWKYNLCKSNFCFGFLCLCLVVFLLFCFFF
jgi:hypothetical protein